MNETIFADTFYWVALLNPRDNFHAQALSLTAKLGNTKIITTDEGNYSGSKESLHREKGHRNPLW